MQKFFDYVCSVELFTARIRRMTEGNVFTLSTISGGGGSTPARSGWWGVPQPGLDGWLGTLARSGW